MWGDKMFLALTKIHKKYCLLTNHKLNGSHIRNWLNAFTLWQEKLIDSFLKISWRIWQSCQWTKLWPVYTFVHVGRMIVLSRFGKGRKSWITKIQCLHLWKLTLLNYYLWHSYEKLFDKAWLSWPTIIWSFIHLALSTEDKNSKRSWSVWIIMAFVFLTFFVFSKADWVL